MKIFYGIFFFGKYASGVRKKILSQVKCLNDLGIPSEIYSITGPHDDYPPLPNVKKFIIPDLEPASPKRLFAKIQRNGIRDSAFKSVIETLNADDILYIRNPSPSRIISKIFRTSRKCKIAVEYQTIEPEEMRLSGDYFYLLMDFFYGDDIRKYSDAIIGVTDEITSYQLSRSHDKNKPHITIGNGFNVDSVPVRTPRPYNNELNLLCVATVGRWHGLDRLLEGMAAYSGKTRFIFHITGGGGDIPRLRQLVEHHKLQDRVLFHGRKTGKDLDTLFDLCHIAVGSLGLHRKGLTQTSELKAREYCARGTPYIIACADPDFPENFPYIHRIPPDESPVDVEKIIEFAQIVSTDPDHPQKMRAYAREQLDWSVKMKRLKAFLETLMMARQLI